MSWSFASPSYRMRLAVRLPRHVLHSSIAIFDTSLLFLSDVYDPGIQT